MTPFTFLRRLFLPRKHWSPLRKAMTLGVALGMVPVVVAVGYILYFLALFWGGQVFWDADAAPWQAVPVAVPTSDDTLLIEVRQTHPVFNRFRVRISVGQHPPENLRRYPVGEWPALYVYVLYAETADTARATIVRLANNTNDHWYDLNCACLRDETEFVPIGDERLLGVVRGDANTLHFEGVDNTAPD